MGCVWAARTALVQEEVWEHLICEGFFFFLKANLQNYSESHLPKWPLRSVFLLVGVEGWG